MIPLTGWKFRQYVQLYSQTGLVNLRPRTDLTILPQRNSVTSSRGVLLASWFRFGKDGAHSDELAARCDPPLFAVLGGKMSLQGARAAFVFVHHVLSRRRKRRYRRWWHQVQLLVLFLLVFGNLHLSLICYNNLSILLFISILLVGRVQ